MLLLSRRYLRISPTIMGTPYVEKWSGLRIQIGQDVTKFGGDLVECLRVRKEKPEDAQIACQECGQMIQPAFSMSVTQLAAYTKKKYGKQLCAECAQAKKEAENNGTDK